MAHWLNTLLPPLCLTCRAHVADWGALCASCFDGLHFIEPPFCEKLSVPFPFESDERFSQEALENPPHFEGARSVLLFTPAARRLVHGLKYHDRQDLSPMLARWMWRAGQDLLAKSDLLVPVPLHWTRLFTRQFNQAGELARHLGKLTGKPFAPMVLKRVKRTSSQTGLNRLTRQENMQSAFKLYQKSAIAGKTILLIDDVFTTGATLEACTKTLREGGAKAVYVLTLARVVV